MRFFERIAAALVSRPIDARDFDGAQPMASRVIVAARAPDEVGHNTYYGSWLSQAIRASVQPIDVGASPWVDPYGGTH